jgi:diaminopropionate ammonia-lyase
MNRYQDNRFRKPLQEISYVDSESDDIRNLHRSFVEYQATPLHELSGLAEAVGVGQIFIKDESERLGLKAFKVLGASYAIYRFLGEWLQQNNRPVPPAGEFYRGTARDAIGENQFTFCTATDGNHGRAVAWVARRLGQRAEIYLPQGTARARLDAIREEGANVHIVEGDYDDAVQQAAHAASENGWQVISDTSWENYQRIPGWIMAGYRTLFEEIHEQPQIPRQIDLVIVQVGVGALAAAAAWYYRHDHDGPQPLLVGVEPDSADCLYRSLAHSKGAMTNACGPLESVMAGLNCGSLSPIAWPMIRDGFDGTLSISDECCFEAMRKLHYPARPDRRIISGESGAAGLAGLLALGNNDDLEVSGAAPTLDRSTTVLLLNTEGDTDPIGFRHALRRAR